MDAIFVIAFVAAGCPPCDEFKGEFRRGNLDTGVQIVLVDVKEQPDLAKKCGVTLTPTFVAIEDERQVLRKSGYTGRESFADWMDEVKRVATD